jgi:hypothetical protein
MWMHAMDRMCFDSDPLLLRLMLIVSLRRSEATVAIFLDGYIRIEITASSSNLLAMI